MVVSTFSIFDWKYHFGVNLARKNKIDILTLNLVPRLIQLCRIRQ